MHSFCKRVTHTLTRTQADLFAETVHTTLTRVVNQRECVYVCVLECVRVSVCECVCECVSDLFAETVHLTLTRVVD